MMVNKGISDEILVLDSDEVDTFDTLLIYEEAESEEKSVDIAKEDFNNLEKISLNDITYTYETDAYLGNVDTEDTIIEPDNEVIVDETITTNNVEDIDNKTENTIDVKIELEDFEALKNDLLEPIDILTEIENLREKSKNTIKKLRELKTICEQAIVDLEHKIEFEQFTVTEGHHYAMMIKELRIKRRFIKNTLDKYDSVSQTITNLDSAFGKPFIKQQTKILNKVIKVQSTRKYTPRILKKLTIQGKAATNSTLDNLEIEISSLLENANM